MYLSSVWRSWAKSEQVQNLFWLPAHGSDVCAMGGWQQMLNSSGQSVFFFGGCYTKVYCRRREIYLKISGRRQWSRKVKWIRRENRNKSSKRTTLSLEEKKKKTGKRIKRWSSNKWEPKKKCNKQHSSEVRVRRLYMLLGSSSLWGALRMSGPALVLGWLCLPAAGGWGRQPVHGPDGVPPDCAVWERATLYFCQCGETECKKATWTSACLVYNCKGPCLSVWPWLTYMKWKTPPADSTV